MPENSGERQLSRRSDLIRDRVEALRRAACLPSSTTITLRTQVKNNLSWLLGGFARKYWAISIKLSASRLGEEAWHLKRRESGSGMTMSKSKLSISNFLVKVGENQSNSTDPTRRLMGSGKVVNRSRLAMSKGNSSNLTHGVRVTFHKEY